MMFLRGRGRNGQREVRKLVNLLKSCRVNNFVDTKLILVILSRKTEVIKFKFAVVADPLLQIEKTISSTGKYPEYFC